MFTFNYNFQHSLTASWLLLLSLTACTTTPPVNLEQIVADSTSQGDLSSTDLNLPNASAEAFIRFANENEGEIRQQYFIKAAELLFVRKSFTFKDKKNQSPEQLALSHNIQIKLLAAKIALASNHPALAMELLPGSQDLTLAQQLDANTIRSDALYKSGHLIDSIKVQIESERLTEALDEKEIIYYSIWDSLSALPTVKLEDSVETDNVLVGWFKLALVMRNAQTNFARLQEDILDWGTDYPTHPVSNTFIDTLISDYITDYSQFGNIAVFLPSEGKYKAIAEVITNGFLSAYYQSTADQEKPTIRFYNTSKQGLNFDALYDRAVSDGADVIIGPIDKDTINQLTQRKTFNVPILTLNYAETTENTPENLFQFGLLPEDEARHVAELAMLQDKNRAAVLVPEGEWGARLANSFRKQYESLGGEVLSQQSYRAGIDDFSSSIRALFNLDDSETRYRHLKQTLNTPLKFTPYRRQDIDMIFVAATQRSARSILPALKFHHAADIQTYATSHVYAGTIDTADRDMDGLLFCDMPWTLISTNPLKNTFKENWKNQENYTRLFALGIDAYALINNLKYLKSHTHTYFSGETGNIIIDEKNRLHRKLVWAKFKKGIPVHIEPVDIIDIFEGIKDDEKNDT